MGEVLPQMNANGANERDYEHGFAQKNGFARREEAEEAGEAATVEYVTGCCCCPQVTSPIKGEG
jgi:hypothetical protein